MKRLIISILILLIAKTGYGGIQGVTGTNFIFTAKDGYISTPDANSIYMWGYALNNGNMQYPGPTLILNQGDTVTITLNNTLPVPVSILFPGMSNVTATGGQKGLITREAKPYTGSVTYTFTAANPGTYLYYSGTNTDLQVEMGLVGAIIVRPTGFLNRAYAHSDSQFDHEYLFLLTEIDPRIHQKAEIGKYDEIDLTDYWPVYWFINGRAAPDTMAEANVPWLPSQPYNCMPMAHPHEKVLLRIVGAGRDMHPFHTHGSHTKVIAIDGKLLESTPGSGADLAYYTFTNTTVPGGTLDAIFVWTGEKMGWDIYGHTGSEPGICQNVDANGFDLNPPYEYCPDHGKPFPVVLPDNKDLTFGQFYSGSPFLGGSGVLPPGEGGFNPNGGYFFMWHSHNEKEIVNNDIFPGGMLTMFVVEHPSVVLSNP